MQNKYEFNVDCENKILSFAGKDFKHYCTIKSAVESVEKMSFVSSSHKPKEKYKGFTEKFGITPNNFKKCFNACMRKIWIEPVESHVMRFAFNSAKKINTARLASVWKMKEVIEQCEKDGIYNVVPMVISNELSPQELKEYFGKSTWKKISKQSMTRNKHLTFARNKQSLISAIDFPSYILKSGSQLGISWGDDGKWIIQHGLYKKHKNERFVYRKMNEYSNLYRDTKMMAQQLGKGFSDKWDYDKMNKKHEEYAKLILLKKYSPEPFDHLKNFKVNNIVNNEYVAELCSSPLSVREEGEAMHHCVGGYTDYVAEDKYLVYSIKKEGKRSSTLGLWKEDGIYRFSQHYGACNARVENESEQEIASLILLQLNNIKGDN